MSILGLRRKHPDRVPVKLIPCSSLSLQYRTYKFLPRYDSSVYDLLKALRNRIRLQPSQSIYFLCNNQLLVPSHLMCQVEQTYCIEANEPVEITYAVLESFG